MSHIRKQIRDHVVALTAALAETVKASRMLKVPEDDLPAILIYTNDEEISQDEAPFGVVDRALGLVLELKVRAQTEDELDDAIDALLATTEAALGADPMFGGLVLSAMPVSIAVSRDSSGSQPIATARLTYSVLYRTATDDPTVSL